MSVHLSTYFNNDNFNNKHIKTFNRNEIPDVLLNNRFLELFSKPMIERPSFAEQALNDNRKFGKTVMAYGKDGASFREFTLVLPRKSKVKRLKDRQIQIKTGRFSITFLIEFDGMNTVLPREFEKYYIGIKDFNGLSIYKIRILIDVKFNFFSLFSFRRWEYYHWIDSFVKQLDESFSKDTFLDRICWDSVLTVIHCSNQHSKSLYETATTQENE